VTGSLLLLPLLVLPLLLLLLMQSLSDCDL
jgi:hypothetical protein